MPTPWRGADLELPVPDEAGHKKWEILANLLVEKTEEPSALTREWEAALDSVNALGLRTDSTSVPEG